MNLSIQSVTDQGMWEDFLLAHAPQSLFQSWSWGEVQERLGVKVWRLGFYEGEVLAGIAQIIKITAKRGIFLHIRHGPVFAGQKQKYLKEVLPYIVKLARGEGALYVRMGPLIEDSPANREFFSKLGFRPAAIHAMDAEYCWLLSLDQTEEQLLANMRKTTRYEIKRAQKLGVSIYRSTDARELDEFFRLYKETSDRHGFVPHTGIREEFEVFAAHNKAILLLGKYDGKTIAGAIILFYGNQGIYHHGASISSKIPASYLVQWEAICEVKKRGMGVYNFWGIAPENKPKHPWRGITLFKKGFGGREIEYIHAQDLPISLFYIVSRAVETVRRLLRGY